MIVSKRVLPAFLHGLVWGLAWSLPHTATAESTGALLIDLIQVRETGHVFVATNPHRNPARCDVANYIVIAAEHDAHDEMVSSVMAAKATGTKIEADVATVPETGCLARYGTTWPIARTLTWK